MAGGNQEEFQRKALELLKSQQDAYLEAVRAWRDAASGAGKMPGWPDPPVFDTLPTPTEIAGAQAEFTARLLKEQSRFMKQLSETLAGTKKNR